MKNSISQKVFANINGMKQGMFIQSENKNNPVLLIVHGGPGLPEYFLNRKYPTNLVKNFTVVWWEQRGTGLSYDKDILPESLTLSQYIDDTIAVTNFLRKRFSQDKIYLMGHSFGTYIGIETAKKAPELYHAYIGVSQITCQLESEKRAYDYMLSYYEKQGDIKTLAKLKSVSYMSDAYKKMRDSMMHQAGIGTIREMSSIEKGVFFESFLSPEYTLMEKVNIWKGRALLKKTNLEAQKWSSECDIRREISSLDLPVYFMSGTYDYTVNYDMAKEYLQSLSAPIKGFYTFKNSAHSPFFEEPDWFNIILKTDVLKQRTTLAD